MFACSICKKTFVEVDQDSIYTTRYGHIFHHHCLTKKPNTRSRNKNSLKLFLEFDPYARVIWNEKTNDELCSLNLQIKTLDEEGQYYVRTISSFKTQLEIAQTLDRKSTQAIGILTLEGEIQNSNIKLLDNQIATIKTNYNLLYDIIKNIESQFSLEEEKHKALKNKFYEFHCENSVMIENLKFEIADLKSMKAYFQSKLHYLAHRNNYVVPKTSKEFIKNAPIPTPEIQIENEFSYKYVPQLKLASKNFLFGCVFLIVEDFNHKAISSGTPMALFNIIHHGGSVEQMYSPRVTHIICGTQKNFNVKQGIEDGKRCVTNFWLSDIAVKEKIIPPWLAHHFPIPYSEEELPCQQYQIVIANFDPNEYRKVELIVKLTGADVVNEVSSSVNFVVALKLEGTLVETALALNVPVVNVQWLNDILNGVQNGLINPKDNRYQYFDLQDPFAVNFDIVSHLMEAWKTPVFYLKNDLIKSSTNHKRKKTNDYPEVINLLDNDVNATNITSLKKIHQHKNPCVIFCGFTMEEQEELKLIVLQLGGNIATHYSQGTHLVMKEPLKTISFLCCLSTIDQIVNQQWLKDSQLISRFKDEMEYVFKEIFDENSMVCNVPDVLANSGRPQLFKHLTFFVTPGIKSPPSTSIKEMILSAGGTIETIIRSENLINCLPVNHYFIICCLEDLYLFDNLLQISHVIYSSDFVTNAIMKQSIELQHNCLSISTDSVGPLANINYSRIYK